MKPLLPTLGPILAWSFVSTRKQPLTQFGVEDSLVDEL